MAGVIINELPKLLAEDPDEKTHSIIVNDPLNTNEPLFIPLTLKRSRVISLSRNPRVSEYEDESIPHIGMKARCQCEICLRPVLQNNRM